MSSLMPDIRLERKLPAIFVLAGAYLGWQLAAKTAPKVYAASRPVKTEIVAFPRTSTIAVVSVPAASTSEHLQAREIARLKTRQRRLEALVEVLRQREELSREPATPIP